VPVGALAAATSGGAAAVVVVGATAAAGGGDVAAAGTLAAATSGVAAAVVGVAVAGVLVVGVAVAGELVVFRSDVHPTTMRSSSNAMTATIQVFRLIPAPCPTSRSRERTRHSSGRPISAATPRHPGTQPPPQPQPVDCGVCLGLAHESRLCTGLELRDLQRNIEASNPHVPAVHRRRVHLDQYLVIPWNGLLDLSEFKNIGRTVSLAYDGFHELPPAPPAEATDARAGALKPLTISHTARTISWIPIGMLSTLLTVVKPNS